MQSEPDEQNLVISKWLLPELLFSNSWSRGTKTLGMRLEIMWNSGDHDSCSQHLEVTYTFKKLKNSQLIENFNDAYIISMPMFATQLVTKVKMEQIIVFMRNRKLAIWKRGISFGGELQSSVRVSHRSKNFGVPYWATPIIITLMPMFATYRVKVEQIILFMKIVHRYFERQVRMFFGGASCKVLTAVLTE